MALRDQDLVAKMEPEVAGMPVDFAANASIAISLKRLADFICGGNDRDGSYHMDVVAYLSREIHNVLDR